MINKRPRQNIKLTKKEKQRLKDVGLVVRGIREKNEMTLEAVEGEGFSSWKFLQAIEAGKKNITITTLFRLASALGVSPVSLIKDLK